MGASPDARCFHVSYPQFDRSVERFAKADEEAEMYDKHVVERVSTVIIGGGQSGLSVGYYLKQRGVPFVILDAGERTGDSWRNRWDSLRLFTPARFDGLVGMPFPGASSSFPTKDQMADYLEEYASHFELPVRTSARVDRVWREGDRFMVLAGDLLIEARHVVVAMSTYQLPRIPAFAADLAPSVVQVHSGDYRNVARLAPGAVLVVGAGNSGAEIAYECAVAGRTTWLAGRDVGHLPFRSEGTLAKRLILPLLFRVVFHRLLTVDTPMGRKVKAGAGSHGTPLIRRRPQDLRAVGVRRVARMRGVRDGKPLLDDGRVLEVSSVVWCTGFDAGLSWLDLPVFDERGNVKHERGFATDVPGLSFVGQHFLYAMSSGMIHGVGRDAERIADALTRQQHSIPYGRATHGASVPIGLAPRITYHG